MRFFKKDTADDHTHNSIHIKPFLISAYYFIQPLKIHIFFLQKALLPIMPSL